MSTEMEGRLRRAHEAWRMRGYPEGVGALFKDSADELASLRALLKEAKEALDAINYTLSVHGKIDTGTPLHCRAAGVAKKLEAALAPSKDQQT